MASHWQISLFRISVVLLISAIFACTKPADSASEVSDDDSPNFLQEQITVPINKARGISDRSDERNKELEEQTEGLFEE